MKRNYFKKVGQCRLAARSQSLVEFTLILPIFLTLMCGVADYGIMINNANILAMAAREGANSAFRQQTNQIQLGLEAAINAAAPRVDFTSSNGGIIITQLQYLPASSSTNFAVVTPISSNCISTGMIYGGGDTLKNYSHIGDPYYTTSVQWLSPVRYLPVSATNFATNQIIFAVEVYYLNNFVTPIGSLIGLVVTPQLYDASFY